MDTDFEAAPAPAQQAYLTMLAIDALLAFMGSVEKLADAAAGPGGALPPQPGRGAGTGACAWLGRGGAVRAGSCGAGAGHPLRQLA